MIFVTKNVLLNHFLRHEFPRKRFCTGKDKSKGDSRPLGRNVAYFRSAKGGMYKKLLVFVQVGLFIVTSYWTFTFFTELHTYLTTSFSNQYSDVYTAKSFVH